MTNDDGLDDGAADVADPAERLEELVEAYRTTFLNPRSPEILPHARKVLEDLRRACCVDRSSIKVDDRGRVDPIATAFNEGKRFVFLRVAQCLDLEPSQLRRMIDARKATRQLGEAG